MAHDGSRPTVLFNRDRSQWPMTFTLRPPQCNTPPRRWWHHYYYRGPHGQSVQVLYSKTKSESENIAQQFKNETVLGFDMEWPWDAHKRPRLQDKVALIQLASERKVALFHIALHKGETANDLIAPTLREIIESSEVIKAGVAVMRADFSRLRAHFNLEPKGAFELSHLHNLVEYGASTPQHATTKLCSLSTQVEQHLGLPLWKGNVRKSDWSRPLNPSQTEYAATDAYASFMLFHCMNAKRLAMNPVPPFPVFAEAYLPFTTAGPRWIQLELVTEDGEARTTTADKFFGVGKDIGQDREKGDGVSSVEGCGKGEADAASGEMKHATGASQANNIEPTSKHDKPEHSRSRTRIRDRKSRADAKLAGNNSGRTSMDSSCWALYSRLVLHRKEVASSQQMSAFIIAHNTVLQALSIQRPSNEQELLRVPGIGKSKASQYGPSWLEIIANFEREQKQNGATNIDQEAGNQVVHGDSHWGLEEPDSKRRKIVGAGCSKEILIPSDEPPAVVSNRKSFQFGKTSLDNNNPALHRPKKQCGSDDDDDDAAFVPPMQLPLSATRKRKRDHPVMSDHRSQPARLPVAPAPILIPTSTPTLAGIASNPHVQEQSERLGLERIVLRNKMEAYVKTVVWAMQPKPTEPLLSENTLHYLINTLPQTIEEFHRVPGIQRLTKACEAVKMNIWRTFEKWIRSPGLDSSAGSFR
ncbi:hypothetical protein F5Y09DRAFT_294317 [Xylaria sp. FL1042]|nr:hypothetical protein F5Y09DRAFT_294317 [Xylaria sp. FL1042]